MKFICVMTALNFQHHYSSLQCHMTIQKSFSYVDLVLKKHFLLLSTLNIFVETMIHFFFLDFFDV